MGELLVPVGFVALFFVWLHFWDLLGWYAMNPVISWVLFLVDESATPSPP